MSVDRIKARIMTVMRNLPPLPAVTRQLLAVMRDEDSSAADVAKVLSSDQALAGKVLKLANSSFYGVPTEVTTMSRAVVIMGFTGVRNMAMGLGTTSALRGLGEDLDMQSFWSHAIANAAACQVLAPHMPLRMDPEEAFLAGLMHDIGAYVLAAAVPQDYAEVIASGGDRLDRERQVIGFTHTQIGEKLLSFWELPQTFCDVARYHHDMEKATGGEQPLTNLVGLADILACVHAGDFESPASEHDLSRLMSAAGLTTDKLRMAMHDMDGKIEEMQDFMQIAGNGRTRIMASLEPGARCVVVTRDDQRLEWTNTLLSHFGYEVFAMESFFSQEAGSENVRLVMIDPQTLTKDQISRLVPFLSSQSGDVCVLTDSGSAPPPELAGFPSLGFIFTRCQLNEVLETQKV